MKHLNLIVAFFAIGEVSAPEELINYIKIITYTDFADFFTPRPDITDFMRPVSGHAKSKRFDRVEEQGVIPPKRVRSSSPEGRESGSKKPRLGD